MGEFCYTCPACTFYAKTKAEANAIALAYARDHAPVVKFCCDLSDIDCCVGEAVDVSFDISLGTADFVWVTTSGDLPDGLTMSFTNGGRTMHITGAPTVPANETLEITITDATGTFITKTMHITVAVVLTVSLSGATVGVPYAETLQAAGSTGNYYWVLSGTSSLPPGLTLNPNGQITGTPTTVGTYGFTVCAIPI